MITDFSEYLDYFSSMKNAALRIVRLKAALTDE
jgi:hypothetical protein